MIVRILTEGQWVIEPDMLADLNELDDAVATALENGDQKAMTAALEALLDEVRTKGAPVPDDVIAESDLILPSPHATVDEVRAWLTESEGLIPG